MLKLLLVMVAALFLWLLSGWLVFGLVIVGLVMAMVIVTVRDLPDGLVRDAASEPDIRHGYLWQRLESALFRTPNGSCELEDPGDSLHTLQLARNHYTARGPVYRIIEQKEEFVGVASVGGNRYRTVTDEYELARHAREITHRHWVQIRTSGQSRLTKVGDVTCLKIEALPDELLTTVERALLHWPSAS